MLWNVNDTPVDSGDETGASNARPSKDGDRLAADWTGFGGTSGPPQTVASQKAHSAAAEHHRLDHEAVSGERPGLGGGSASSASSPGPINPMLRKLHADLGGDQVVFERFVCDYLALLSTRVETIRAALRADDQEATVVSLLSLETTSVMLGADGVVSAAHALRAAVERGERDPSGALTATLLTAAAALRVELEDVGFRASR